MKFSRNPVSDRLALIRQEAEERDAARRSETEGIERFNYTQVDRDALRMISEDEARGARAAAFKEEDKVLHVAIFSTTLPKAISLIHKLEDGGYAVVPYIATMGELGRLFKHYEGLKGQKKETKKGAVTAEIQLEGGFLNELEEVAANISGAKEKIELLGSEPKTSELIAMILGIALVLDASDVHLEYQTKEKTMLRYRIDGILKDTAALSKKPMSLLVSRIKLLAGLKLNIHEAPQDGRFTIKSAWGDIEVRVSVVPAEYGEALVLRVLNPRKVALDIGGLGFREDDREIIIRELAHPNGIILVTGPTGSGKTTTLYAFLKEKYSPEIKIITIEDPIEYHLEGVEQTQVYAGSGYTFASGLRSILRQDPDIILVGEIRDLDTAQMSIHAALTGHLVFSTLHTNSASGAVPRLIDLGVKVNIVGSALTFVLSQRLVRKLCVSCREEASIDAEMEKKIRGILGRLPERAIKNSPEIKLYQAVGCGKCDGGYKGRTIIAELLGVNDEIRELIGNEVSERDIEDVAVKKQGMVRMQEDGILKSIIGITTIEEVERATGPIVW